MIEVVAPSMRSTLPDPPRDELAVLILASGEELRDLLGALAIAQDGTTSGLLARKIQNKVAGLLRIRQMRSAQRIIREWLNRPAEDIPATLETLQEIMGLIGIEGPK